MRFTKTVAAALALAATFGLGLGSATAGDMPDGYKGAPRTLLWSPGPIEFFDHDHANKVTMEEMKKMGINLRGPDQAVGTLSGGERQTVAIARAVHFGAKVLILDEPTSALGVRQTSNVLATIDKVRKQGIGVVFITHNVRHALAVGDRFTVLNRGQTLGTAMKGEITPEELQDLMAGGQELATLEGSLGGTV